MKINKCKTRNKYAMMINKYARMIDMSGDSVFGFYMMNASNKSIFGFLNGKKCKVDKSCWKGVSYD